MTDLAPGYRLDADGEVVKVESKLEQWRQKQAGSSMDTKQSSRTCATEGCLKPLVRRNAKYCPDCAKVRDRACKAAYAARHRDAWREEGAATRHGLEFYAPLEEVLSAGNCASAVEVHAALAARMGPDAKVPGVSALRFHCRTHGVRLPKRNPREHAERMRRFRKAQGPQRAQMTGGQAAESRAKRPQEAAPAQGAPVRPHERLDAAWLDALIAAEAEIDGLKAEVERLRQTPPATQAPSLDGCTSMALEAEQLRRAIVRTDMGITTAMRQAAAMATKNVRRKAELARVEHLLRKGSA